MNDDAEGCWCMHLTGLDGIECVQECLDDSHEIDGMCECNPGFALNDAYQCTAYEELCVHPLIWFNDYCYQCTEQQRLDSTLQYPECVDNCDGYAVIEGAIGELDRFCVCGELH